MRLCLLLIGSALLPGMAGCGFHLQGRVDYGPELASVHLQVPDKTTALARELRRSLEVAKVDLVADRETATVCDG